MLGLEREIGCLGKRCPVLILTACGACLMARTAAAARKEDPSLPPLNLSTMSGAVKDVIYRRGISSSIQGHRQQKHPLMKYLNLVMQQSISRTSGH